MVGARGVSPGWSVWFIPALELVLMGGASLAMLGTPTPTAGVSGELIRASVLVGLVLFLGRFVVRLDRGSLRLTMIGTQAAAMLLFPPLAGFVGLVAGLSWIRN